MNRPTAMPSIFPRHAAGVQCSFSALLPALVLAPAVLVAAATVPASWATLLVIAPVAEELVFRGGLQEALLRRLEDGSARGALAANLLTALAFAAAHVALRPGLLAGLTVFPALALGWVYQRRRCVAPCIALHALCNAAWLSWAGGSL